MSRQVRTQLGALPRSQPQFSLFLFSTCPARIFFVFPPVTLKPSRAGGGGGGWLQRNAKLSGRAGGMALPVSVFVGVCARACECWGGVWGYKRGVNHPHFLCLLLPYHFLDPRSAKRSPCPRRAEACVPWAQAGRGPRRFKVAENSLGERRRRA